MTPEPNRPYRLELAVGDVQTLRWLADHGYDAGLWDRLYLEHAPDECDHADCRLPYLYSLSEPDTWAWVEAIAADPHAYLTCNGSQTLTNALRHLEESVI